MWWGSKQIPYDVEAAWIKEAAMSKRKRRRRYRCGEEYVRLVDIDIWPVYVQTIEGYENVHSLLPPTNPVETGQTTDDNSQKEYEKYLLNREINRKLSTWRGDITRLEIDAVVNAANQSLLGGGGIDGAIHSAAGNNLYLECKKLGGCPTGLTKISRGYSLPAKYVLHTVGPIGAKEEKLRSCYETCLNLCIEHNIKSVAFCGISTGIFGYPLYDASHIACETVRKWMENSENLKKIDRIIFCTYLSNEKACYEQLLPKYFPPVADPEFLTEYQNWKENYSSEPEPDSEPEVSDNDNDNDNDNDSDSVDDSEDEFDDQLEPVTAPPVVQPPLAALQTAPHMTEPCVTESHVTEPYVKEPHVTEPNVTAPHVTAPHVTEPYVTESHVTEPHVTEPHVTEPHVTEPHVTEPPVIVPHVTEPHVTESHVTESHVTEPPVIAPHVTEPHVTESHVTEPHVTEPHVTEPHVTEPHVTEPHVTEPHVTEPHVTELHVTEPHVTAPHVAEPHVTEPHTAQSHMTEPHMTLSSITPAVPKEVPTTEVGKQNKEEKPEEGNMT